MTQADKAEVTWGDPQHKKGWTVRIQVGAEVIRRHVGGPPRDAEETAIRSLAVAAAKDDGYDLDPARVEIHRP